jgi:hypothetical protein
VSINVGLDELILLYGSVETEGTSLYPEAGRPRNGCLSLGTKHQFVAGPPLMFFVSNSM